MIGMTKKMKRMGVKAISYGRDIKITQASKITDKGVVKFHALPTFCTITVTYMNNTNEEMSKATFEVLANCEKVSNFIDKHFVD